MNGCRGFKIECALKNHYWGRGWGRGGIGGIGKGREMKRGEDGWGGDGE